MSQASIISIARWVLICSFSILYGGVSYAQDRSSESESGLRDVSIHSEAEFQICTNDLDGAVLNVPVWNLGTDTATTLSLAWLLDGIGQSYIGWNGTLLPGDSMTIELPLPSSVTASGTYWIDLSISNPLGDDVPQNDTGFIVLRLIAPQPITDPLKDTAFCSGDVITASADPHYSSYLWNDGSSLKGINLSSEGQYFVAMTDSAGCVQRDTMTASFHQVDDSLLPDDSIFCGVNQQEVVLDNSWSQINWDNQSSSSTRLITETGTYSVTFRDSNSCEYYREFNWVFADNPEVVLPDTISLCGGEPELVQLSYEGYDYQWSNGELGSSITLVQPGTYVLEASNIWHCTTWDTVEAVLRDNPNPDLGSDTIICSGEETVLNPGYYDSYTWSNGDTSSSVPVNSAGTYSVEVKDEYGCTGIANIEMVEKTVELSLGQDTTICEGSLLVLTPQGDYSAFLWNDGSTSNNMVINETGNYVLQVTAHGKCHAKDSIFVQVEELPVADMDLDVQGTMVEFTNESNASQVSWNFGDGNTSTDENPVHIYANLGVFLVTMEVSNMCGVDTRSEQVEISTLAVEDLLQTVDVRLYPNPTEDYLTLRLIGYDADAIYRIYDGVGRLVDEGNIGYLGADKGIRLDVSAYASGFYQVQLSNDLDVRVLRFLKQ